MFASREDAGQRLGRMLKDQGVMADLVLGLPRGGVVVAAEVARHLELPLSVLVVRKIGHPWHREFAIGALAEDGVVVLDETMTGNPVLRAEIDAVIEEETRRLCLYEATFEGEAKRELAGCRVLVVDDGLATGATTEAAVLSARKQQAASIVVAAPVASREAVHRVASLADEVRVLWMDPNFDAVGRYYDVFAQTTDNEVLALLRAKPALNQPGRFTRSMRLARQFAGEKIRSKKTV
jgi:putative phosphoribosyl transferase